MEVVSCDRCGGSVAFDAQHQVAACLFCASVELRPESLAKSPFDPKLAIPFAVQGQQAHAAFRAWAGSSWWYPKQLRAQRVELEPLWLPAWRFEAEVEAHYAALRSASNDCGKQPVSGLVRMHRKVWVPASRALTHTELRKLAPFDETAAILWTLEHARTPLEVSVMTEPAALSQARALFVEQARSAISREKSVSDCKVCATLTGVQARALMLPVHIGTFQFRDRAWRVLINGQSGKLVGRAPIDRRKVAVVVVLLLLLLLLAGVLLWPGGT